MPRVTALLGAACVLASWGCRGGGIVAPEITDDELQIEESLRARQLVEERIELSGRIREIEFAIVTSSASFCRGVEQPRLGMLLASQASFTSDAAKKAAEEIGLDDRIRIVYVVPRGPLDVAKVRPWDVVLAAGGRAIEKREDLLMVNQENPNGFDLRLQRDAEVMVIPVEPKPACPVSLSYSSSSQLLTTQRTRTNGTVPRGLLRLFQDEDDRALLIGHQLAHLIFDRRGDDSVTRERRADRLGLYLTARAGYDVSRAAKVWETLVGEYPWLTAPTAIDGFENYPHRGVALRMPTIQATVREIESAIEQGQTLVPKLD